LFVVLALAGCGANANHASTQSTANPAATGATAINAGTNPAAATAHTRSRTATTRSGAASTNQARTAPAAQPQNQNPVAAPAPGPTPTREPVPVPRSGDKSLQTFGASASQGDFAAVAAAVRSYNLALAQHDGAAACRLLVTGAAAQLSKIYGGGKLSCAQILTQLSGAYPPQLRASLRAVRVTDARLKGDSGFAFFTMPTVPHGFIPVRLDQGRWRVAALSGSSVP
jgi:hypothetical protein